MNWSNEVARKIFEGRYPYQMPFQSYLSLLEKGFNLLETAIIESRTDLGELKAIRIALEYRMEMFRLTRKKQIKRSWGSASVLAAVA